MWDNFWNVIGNVGGSALGVLGAFVVAKWQIEREKHDSKLAKLNDVAIQINKYRLTGDVNQDLMNDKLSVYQGAQMDEETFNLTLNYFLKEIDMCKTHYLELKTGSKDTNLDLTELLKILKKNIEEFNQIYVDALSRSHGMNTLYNEADKNFLIKLASAHSRVDQSEIAILEEIFEYA